MFNMTKTKTEIRKDKHELFVAGIQKHKIFNRAIAYTKRVANIAYKAIAENAKPKTKVSPQQLIFSQSNYPSYVKSQTNRKRTSRTKRKFHRQK